MTATLTIALDCMPHKQKPRLPQAQMGWWMRRDPELRGITDRGWVGGGGGLSGDTIAGEDFAVKKGGELFPSEIFPLTD